MVAKIERKMLSFHNRHRITMADGTVFQYAFESNFSLKYNIKIDGLGWLLHGDTKSLFIGDSYSVGFYELYDADKRIVAVIERGIEPDAKFYKYRVNIYRPEAETKVVAILTTLQHINRAAARTSIPDYIDESR